MSTLCAIQLTVHLNAVQKGIYCKDSHIKLFILIPPREPSGIVLASSAGGPGFNPQSRTASYQRRYKNGTSSSLV